MNTQKTDMSLQIERRGIMLVLSSPSGAGKSTIAREVLSKEQNLKLSVSVTTRDRRGSEIDGTHYHFISDREFDRMRDSDSLLEWAQVHSNFYGTPADPVEDALNNGKDMLFDIDWQGGLQLMEKARIDVVSIFILPPSLEELKSRLVRRAEDAPEVIEKRLENAMNEIPHWSDYDYVVVNDDLERAFGQVSAILQAERLRRDRRPGLFDYVNRLIG
ncbi:MAG: guanylate kinase [Hyphomicrobiales bacterium]|nr:guanylate kinase [Hyphomicrobiales bacterium]